MDMDESVEAVCRSTEEMISDIESVNDRTDVKNLVIFSTDYEAYYPSLDIEEVAKVAKDEFITGDLDVNVDVKELALYLAVTKERSELESLGLDEVTHTRLHSRGRKPGITTEEILERGNNTKTKFKEPVREPTKDEERKMFGVALETLINAAMSNHVYSFNGSLRKQKSGGAIGNILTASLAVMFMIKWKREFAMKAEEAVSEIENAGIYKSRFYIDDGNHMGEALPPGARLDEDGKVRIFPDCVEPDRDIPEDERTAEVYGQIANSVSNFVKVTVDYPSKNDSQWMPLLDLQVQIQDNQIFYKFYKKPVSNPKLMLEKSAMPMKVKRSSLVQEGIRRLRNTKRELLWDVKSEILSEFSHKLKLSGYSAKFRQEVIQSAVRGYRQQCERADKGGTPLHRPRSYQREERRKKKLLAATSWYRPASVVGFFPMTAGGKLAKQVQQVVTEELGRLDMTGKIVETAGKSLRSQISKLDLTGCFYGEKLCWLCQSGEAGASHTRAGVGYRGWCARCGAEGKVAEYWGESGSSGTFRTSQHRAAVIKNDSSSDNAFVKHLQLFHPENAGDPDSFKVRSHATFKKSLERQVNEGVNIVNSKADHLMNSKSEYHQPAVHRVTVTRQLEELDTRWVRGDNLAVTRSTGVA